MKNMKWFLPATAIAFALLLGGCQKSANEDINSAEETEMSELSVDDNEAAGIYTDVFEMVTGVDDQLGFGESPIFGEGNFSEVEGIIAGDPANQRCVSITITPRDIGVFPKTVVLDFGSGCKGPDGRTRSGKIITVYSKPLFIPGAEATTRFDGYHVGEHKIEGVHITKNESTSTTRIITRVVREGKITAPNGNYRKWAGKHTNTQIDGQGTPGYQKDDVFSITGSAEGERKVGDNITKWSRIILSPVIKAVACQWPSKGEVKITRNGKSAILNYGDGGCDNKATMTFDGRTKEITLR